MKSSALHFSTGFLNGAIYRWVSSWEIRRAKLAEKLRSSLAKSSLLLTSFFWGPRLVERFLGKAIIHKVARVHGRYVKLVNYI